MPRSLRERKAAGSDPGALSGDGITSLMRIFLFLAALGVISQGLTLNPANPPASVFQLAAGDAGYKIFGIVMWSAAVTSIIGCAYTSVSFLRSFSETLNRNYRYMIIAFIVFSAAVFSFIGQPVKVLIVVGALNGLILPLVMACMLLASQKKQIVGDYHHPKFLLVSGWLVFAIMTYMAAKTFLKLIA